MITQTSPKEELLIAIDETVSQLLELTSALNEEQVNAVPYEGSWTVGQVLEHIIMSTNVMAEAMRSETKPAERDSGERIAELRAVFLNFTLKLQSPDIIIPQEKTYEKEAITSELRRSFDQLKQNAGNADLTGLVEGLPLGPATKLEILHFVLYHTQRHLHQVKRICEALGRNE